MWQKMLQVGSGGSGGEEYTQNYYVTSASVGDKITCGFRPKFIVVSDTITNGGDRIMYIYDEKVSKSEYLLCDKKGTYYCPFTDGTAGISAIYDDGFGLKFSQAQNTYSILARR